MALIDYVDLDDAEGRVAMLLAADAETFGRPSLFARMLANEPSILEARARYVTKLRETGILDKRERELIYVVVSLAHDCEYCAVSHTRRLVEEVGMPQDRVDAIADGDRSSLSERERTILRFAERAATDPKQISDADVEALNDIGFDDADLVALTAVTATAVAATTIMDTLNIHPDDGVVLE
ncbi:carboxymuconolactone decarboxylase family protein [Haloarchaeobius sp. TZWWS8]|uniref:carboxymuconolactone decarboxylase family protein n=1 Tax=Haloarchaeobius sp. TZWWS8 TaxID=3446121 RepID=UPI003EB7BD51